MTDPIVMRQLRSLSKTVDDMRHVRDVVFSESLRRRTLNDVIFAGVIENPGDANESSAIGPGGGTVNHAETYDKKVLVEIDGSSYYIGLYNA